MMPAASNKIETKPSAEALDPSKQFLSLLDKKVRNIEKRKSKLDAVRAKQQAGEVLEKEQKEAITHYESVINNLEFARELQKNFNSIAADIEKQQKKQAKREKMEKAASDVKRIGDILKIQTTLDSMGSDTVRQDFKTGKHGAVVLTEDNLNALDELYPLISPSRDGEGEFTGKVNTASEHIISLIESRDRAIAGSTYKELMELVTLINGCGYFEQAKEAEKAVEEPEAEEAEEAVEEEVSAPMEQTLPPAFPDAPEVDLQNNATIQASATDLNDSPLSHPQVLQTSLPQSEPVGNTSFFSQQQDPNSAPFPPSQVTAPEEPAVPKARALPEIISSVGGTFSFLQDSEIELDSPHMDPAVVAAQPMMRPPSGASQLPGGFPAPPMVDGGLEVEGSDPLSLSQSSLPPANPLNFSSASQTAFAAAGRPPHSQTLPPSAVSTAPTGPDVRFQSSVDDQSQVAPQSHSAPHGMMGQRGAGEPSAPSNKFDLPPSIPMPPSQSQQDSAAHQEKKFQLNASATEFQSRSMYPNMPGGPSQPSQQDARSMQTPATVADFNTAQSFAQASGDFSQTNNFQNSFQRGGQRGGSSGPGYRGGQRGGRGGNNMAATNNMQNGFNPRPQNGANRPSNRGGAGGFQQFAPRNDYQSQGNQGYQGYNNANGFSAATNVPFQKRGGQGGQGFPRGGVGGNRGAGGMRGSGGPPRQGPPRGAGGVRGGMTRSPNQ